MASRKASVWDREDGDDTLGERTYLTVFTAATLIGLFISAWCSTLTYDMKLGGGTALALLFLPFIGVFVAGLGESAAISILGYLLICAPFGLALGPVLALYTTASLMKVTFLTGCVSVGMCGTGYINPGLLRGWGRFLVGSLWVFVICSFGLLFAGALGLPVSLLLTVHDIIGVVLFSALMIFDVGRAMEIPKTFKNAVDAAIGVYLDILNMFLLLLRLVGVKKD